MIRIIINMLTAGLLTWGLCYIIVPEATDFQVVTLLHLNFIGLTALHISEKLDDK